MTNKEKKPDIVEVLEEFRRKILVFDKELERLRMPYVKAANKHLGDVVGITIDELKEYERLLKEGKLRGYKQD